MPLPKPPNDQRPVTRFARLTRWVPTPRRVWRWGRARPKAAAFALGMAALLAWVASDHVVTAWTGHRLRYQGHAVSFGQTIDEDLRRWAPLPTDSSLYLTPVGVSFVQRNRNAGTVDEFLDALDRMPGVSHVGFDYVPQGLTAAQAGRAAARHTDRQLLCAEVYFETGALAPFTSRPHWEDVQLPGCRFPEGELGRLAGAKRLELLRVEHATGVAGSLRPLAGHPTLKYVLAEGSDLNDADLAALGDCPSLVAPRLAKTDITDAGLAALNGRALGWGTLAIAGTAVTDAGLEAFGPHPGHGLIDLSGTVVGDAGVATAVWHCPNLTAVLLNRTVVTEEGVAALRPLAERLERLELADTAVTGKGLAALGPCPELYWLDLSGTAVTDADLAAFPERYPSLISLDLHGTAVTDDGRATLREAFPSLMTDWDE